MIHNIIKSNKERISQKIILEQRKKGETKEGKTHCMKAKEIGKSIGVNIDQGGK